MDLVFRDQNAVVSFGANMPQNMSGFLELENPEIDKNVDMIKQISGSLNFDGTNTALALSAKTLKPKDAEELGNFLKGIAEVGKILIGSSKGEDKRVYSRMIENAKISNVKNEVMIEIKVPQSDLDVLVGAKK